MKKSHWICYGAILVLLVGNIVCAARVLQIAGELRTAQETIETQRTNKRLVEFTQLFVTKVLRTQEDVDFETRLQMENKVRALGDMDILDTWTQFTESKTEAQAQEEVLRLLELLVTKLQT